MRWSGAPDDTVDLKIKHFEIQNVILNVGTPLKFYFSSITPFFYPKLSIPYCTGVEKVPMHHTDHFDFRQKIVVTE